MTVKTHIYFKDFLLFNLKNSFPRIIIFSVIILVVFGLNFYNSEPESRLIFKKAALWFVLIFIFMMVRSYVRIKSTFYSSKNIQETICYTFTEEKVQTKGETFEGEFLWSSVFRVKEKKDWFLIYQSKTTMNMVPKKCFERNQIPDMRQIIKNSGVKAKLLKN